MQIDKISYKHVYTMKKNRNKPLKDVNTLIMPKGNISKKIAPGSIDEKYNLINYEYL